MPTVNDHFLDAARRGNFKKFKHILLKQGVDANIIGLDSWTALMIASFEGHKEIVVLLLEASDININIQGMDGETALYLACWNGHYEIVCLLLKNKADVNQASKEGTSPLAAALNADPDLTALWIAGLNRRDKIAALLLETEGIEVNTQDIEGQTPLFLACCTGNRYEIVRRLIEKEADVNQASNNGRSPLMLSSQNEEIQNLKLLLAAGAKPDPKTLEGDTALHFAIQRSLIEAAEVLIDHGANLFAKNNSGQMPLDMASSEEIKARLLLYPLRNEVATLKNFVLATSFGNIPSANDDQLVTLQGKLDKVMKENAQLRNTVEQLQSTVSQLNNAVDELLQQRQAVSKKRPVEWLRRQAKKCRGFPFFSRRQHD